jgi:CheY-like chemotaxis protein/HPt (histidine-containing phosphotransfer) domain-containing protein
VVPAVGRVLLVEDVLANQKVAASMLRRQGVEVVVAENGREGVDLWAAGGFDLVFMDCLMPVMDGFDATRAIRERERVSGGHVPIVALTANALPGERQRCLDAGMDDYITKPFDAKDLAAALARSLRSGTAEPPAPAAPGGTERWAELPSIDPRVLARMREDLGAEFGELVPACLQSIDAILLQFPAVLDDAGELGHLAHALKSAAGNLGAARLQAMAAELERRAGASACARSAGQLQTIAAERARVAEALAALGLGGPTA